jgi:acyl-CoA reductase-like NAD-dependent aldehyde dehydrogenase
VKRELLIAGRWVGGPAYAHVRSPHDGRVVSEIAQASKAQIEEALAFAHAQRRAVGERTTGQRREVLQKVIAGLRERSGELAEVISAEAGKPIQAARVEVNRCVETFTLAAAELTSFGGQIIPIDLDPAAAGFECEVRRFPAGVAVGIVPFNFPLNLGAHKVAPALAVGAPIIIKPPHQAPSAQLILGELALQAGAPPGALQVVPCATPDAETLATDPRVRVLSFTGSAKVGWALKAKTRGKVILELGGNAAALVCADADLDWAAKRLALGGLTYAGQVCIKVQRIYVEQKVHDAFLPRLLAEVQKLPAGDPAREETVVGPVIDDASAERIEEWLKEAVDAGARILTGGTRDGRHFKPTVVTDVPAQCRLQREEVFGPVIIVAQTKDFEAGLDAINDSDYGLQAGLFTRDLLKTRRAFHRLEVGGLILNDSPAYRSDAYPYGGVKGSGLGREGVRSAMEDLTEERVLVTRPLPS